MSGFNRRTAMLAAMAGLTVLAGQAPAQFVWLNGAGGNWSTGANWVGGTSPTSAATTTLTFGDPSIVASTYTSTNDIGATPFQLNALTFNNNAGTTVTIAGLDPVNNGLNFVGTNPTITKGAGNATITSAVTIGANLTTAGGAGTLTFANTVNDNGGGFNVIKTGTGPLAFTSTGASSFNALSLQAGSTTISAGTVNLNQPDPGTRLPGLEIGSGSNQVASLTISGGSQVTVAENTFIGNGTSAANQSTGTLTVTGAGTVLTDNGTTSGRFAVGAFGNGTLNITAGAVVNARFLLTNRNGGSSATILVDGAGTQLNIVTGPSGTGAFQVASNNAIAGNSTGTVTVSNGAAVNVVGNFFGGAVAGNTANINVTGPGTTFTVSGFAIFGGGGSPAGTGNLNLSAGATFTGATVSFAGNGNTNGTSTAVVDNATLNVTSQLQIGSFTGEVGNLTIQNGGVFNSTGTAFIGAAFTGSTSGTGTVTVTGAGSTYTQTGNIQLGTSAGGVGTINVLNGGTANVSGTIFAGPSGGPPTTTGTINVSGFGSTLTDAGLVIISGGGTPGGVGALNVNNGAIMTVQSLTLTQNDGGSSVTTVSAGKLAVTGNLAVGFGATSGAGGTAVMNVVNGGQVTVGGGTFAGLVTVTGTINVGGYTSTFTTLGTTELGGNGATPGAVGVFNVNAGGTANLAGPVFLFGGGTLNANGGVLGATTVGGLGDGVTGSSVGTVAVGTGSTLTINTNGLNLAFSGVVSGAGGVTKTGLGTQIFSGGVNTFTGPVGINGGTLAFGTINDLGAGTAINFSGGTLQYAGTNTADVSARTVTINAGGATIDTGANNVTFANGIGNNGNGALTKLGTGTLTLNPAPPAGGPTGFNSYFGGTNVLNGTVSVPSDLALGALNVGTLAAPVFVPIGNVTGASLGTLAFTGTTTTGRSFAMDGGTVSVTTGQVVTFNGGLVSGATLDGTGGFATDPTNGAHFVSVTTTPSVAITSNSAADQFVHVINGAVFNVAPGVNATGASTTVNLNGFTNQGSGSVTIGAGSRTNVANFQSYGLMNMAPATVTGQVTEVINSGGSAMFFNGGSRTFVGTPATAGTNVAGIDLHGQNIVIAGGLFVNNGFLADSTGTPGKVIVDYGALFKGAGTQFVSVVTQNGGRVQAGNSPGSMGFGQFVFGPGGVNNYVFAIDNATGAAGPKPDAAGLVSGWGLVKAVKESFQGAVSSGNFIWSANPTNKVTVAIDTLVNPTTVGTDVPGMMANFNPNLPYSWQAAHWDGKYKGPEDVGFLDASTSFDTSSFLNPVAGAFGWSLDEGNHTLSLVYNPTAVPEPGTLALTAIAGLGLARSIRRRYLGRKILGS